MYSDFREQARRVVFLCGLIVFAFPPFNKGYAQDLESSNPGVLSIGQFIELAVKNDASFEEILIDQATLAYHKGANLPAGDLVLSVKGQYDMYLSQDREDPEFSASLSKLFPYTGTEITATYENKPSMASAAMSSELSVLISQPIAQNAFGRSTRLHDQILDIEIDVAKHQIVEAYEDYLAALIDVYYTWYSAYENLKIGQASYEQNLKLQEEMLKRQKNKIALPVDVNKVQVQVIAKKENVITLTETYRNLLNTICKAVRVDRAAELIPSDPSDCHVLELDFDAAYKNFKETSRTYQILRLLESKSSLDVKRSADDLLPSTNLLIGYKTTGKEWQIKNEDNQFYAGLSLEWPVGNQVDRAEYEIDKIEYKKTKLSNENKFLELEVNLRNLYLQIERERELIQLADQKIELAQSILEEEAANYSFGKITLNDYIDAVNRVDTNKFNKIVHVVQLRKFYVEWLRLTDQLVRAKQILP